MDIQDNRKTQLWPNEMVENTAQRNENCHAGSQHDTTTSASISSEGDRESFIRLWRGAQTWQPEIRRTLHIPRSSRSIDSRTCEQNDRNFMSPVKIPAFDEQSEGKVWLNRVLRQLRSKEDGIPNRSWMSCYPGFKGLLEISCLHSCLQIISATMNLLSIR